MNHLPRFLVTLCLCQIFSSIVDSRVFIGPWAMPSKDERIKNHMMCAPSKTDKAPRNNGTLILPNTMDEKITSCTSTHSVIDTIIQQWNSHVTSKGPSFTVKKKSKQTIVDKEEELKKSITSFCQENKCDTDYNWLPSNISASMKKYFRPFHSSEWNVSPNEWLSNFDIDAVLLQYNDVFPSFHYVTSSSIDYDTLIGDDVCVTQQLCKLDIGALYESGIRTIGIVFNLDKHTQPGSHWVTVCISLEQHLFAYVDSNGISAPPSIRRLYKTVVKQALEAGIVDDEDKLEYIENFTRYQKTNTECGMFCIYFLILAMYRFPIQTMIQTMLEQRYQFTDDYMRALRTQLFN